MNNITYERKREISAKIFSGLEQEKRDKFPNGILFVRLKEGEKDSAFQEPLKSTEPNKVVSQLTNAIQRLIDNHDT